MFLRRFDEAYDTRRLSKLQRITSVAASHHRYVLLTGEFERGKAMEISGFKDRAARGVLYALIKKGLLISDTPRGPVRLGFPIDVVERWFPLLYPGTKR